MIKALETAIAKVRAMPEDKQQLAAELLEELAAIDKPYVLSPAERQAVREGLGQADRGEFASDDDVDCCNGAAVDEARHDPAGPAEMLRAAR